MHGNVFRYKSGEVIKKGDRVFFHGEPGEVDFVITEHVGDPTMDWYIDNEGPGVMVVEPKAMGRAYIRETEKAEDLVFVSRARADDN